MHMHKYISKCNMKSSTKDAGSIINHLMCLHYIQKPTNKEVKCENQLCANVCDICVSETSVVEIPRQRGWLYKRRYLRLQFA